MEQETSGQQSRELAKESLTQSPSGLSLVLRQRNGTELKVTPLSQTTDQHQYVLTTQTKRYLLLEEISTREEHLVCLICSRTTPQMEHAKLICWPCQKVFPRVEDAKYLSERTGVEISVDDMDVSP